MDDDSAWFLVFNRRLTRTVSSNGAFNIDQWTDYEFERTFRFEKRDVQELCLLFEIPTKIVTENRYSVGGVEGLLILLHRMNHPVRLMDTAREFGCGESKISEVVHFMLKFLYDRFHKKLFFDEERIPASLMYYSAAVGASSPLKTVWGFIDGTFRRIARPVRSQRQAYNGHYRAHGIKFQSVVTPDGLISSLWGQLEILRCSEDLGWKLF